ncbi:unnamed protein product, partial [Oikopleura dioica]
PWTSHDQSQAE